MNEECVGCVYHAKNRRNCALRVCKGKTIITIEGYLRKVSKKDIPCNRCKHGAMNIRSLQMECKRFNQITDTESGARTARSMGCTELGDFGGVKVEECSKTQ